MEEMKRFKKNTNLVSSVNCPAIHPGSRWGDGVSKSGLTLWICPTMHWAKVNVEQQAVENESAFLIPGNKRITAGYSDRSEQAVFLCFSSVNLYVGSTWTRRLRVVSSFTPFFLSFFFGGEGGGSFFHRPPTRSTPKFHTNLSTQLTIDNFSMHFLRRNYKFPVT